MQSSSPCPTPMAANMSISATEGTALPNPIEFRKLIGALQYIAYTKPYISYSVNKLNQFL